MLNNEYYKIYNESLLIIFDSLNNLLIEKESFINNYTLYNNKKITDYMLFVRDFYKNKKDKHNNIMNKSKYISILWKELDKDEKKKYKIKAEKMLKYFKENYQNEKKNKIKIKIKKEVKEDKKIIFHSKRNNILKKIKINNIEYYIDCYKNLIDINKHKYIGYLDNSSSIIHFFH
jgi:hypothetical protein